MNKDWNTIDFLRHVRHDWLNKIQLIKGNLALNKEERVKEIIEMIIMEAKHEAKLSNLHMPQFALLLLTCNWENNCFQLEYEVLNEEKCLFIEDAALTDWTVTFFEVLNSCIKTYAENHLSVSIDPQSKGVSLYFDFSGIIEDKVSIEHFLKSKTSDTIKVTLYELTEEELTLELFVYSNHTK
ncbi:Spo0B C-terminal domain-containing protein [Niallia sp. 01092]|uniref:Spo0B C-terminal domain-containing protein n=1 Tax=unclassified Niallia TaxID=2837522 RepID=UPI003FCF6961